jgi:hypothetical protein
MLVRQVSNLINVGCMNAAFMHLYQNEFLSFDCLLRITWELHHRLMIPYSPIVCLLPEKSLL